MRQHGMVAYTTIILTCVNLFFVADAMGKGLEKKDKPKQPTTVVSLHVKKEMLTLEDVIALAKQNYPSIRQSVAKIKAAEANVSLAKMAYIPRADFVLQNNFATANRKQGFTFPMPGLMSVSGGNESQSWQGYWGNYTGLVNSWTAIDFGYRKANLTAAKAAEQRAESEQILTEFDVTSAAANAFLQAATAQSLVTTAEADLERSQVLVKMVSTLVKSGLRPGVEQSRAAADEAQSKTRVIKAKAQAKMALINLAHTIGLPGESITIDAKPFMMSSPANSPVNIAVDKHPALESKTLAIQELMARKKAISRSYWPKLNLLAGISGRGSNFSDDQSVSGWKGTYPTLMNYAVGVAINYSPTAIFEGRVKERIEQANIEAEVAKYDELVSQLKTANLQSKEMIESALAIAEHTPIQTEAANMANLQITQRYKAGLATLYDVADAHRTLTQAEIDNALARLGVWSAFLGGTEAQGSLTPFLSLVQQYQSLNLYNNPSSRGSSSALPPLNTQPGSTPQQYIPTNIPNTPVQSGNTQGLGLPSQTQSHGAPLDPSQTPYTAQPSGGK